MGHGAVHMVQLFQAEQADAEGLEVGRLVAHQRHAGGGLQAVGEEFLAVVDVGIVGVAHHHTGRLEAFGCHALDTAALEQRTHAAAQLHLLGLDLLETVGTGFLHHFAQAGQRVGGHGGVVHMATGLVGFHYLQPFFQVAGKAGAGGVVDGVAGAGAEHHHGAGGRAAPAFLRRTHQHVHAGGFHVHPHRARGNAIEHQQAADGMDCIGHLAQVAVGQNHARSSFHVRCKHHLGLLDSNGFHHLFDGAGNPRRLVAVAGAAGLEHHRRGRDAAHVENLRPAVAEPAVADDHDLLAGGELPRHSFHAKGAAAGHQNGRVRVVDLFQNARDVFHDTLETLRHVVQRAVGIDHREFEQPFRVDVGQKARHGGSGMVKCGFFWKRASLSPGAARAALYRPGHAVRMICYAHGLFQR